MSEFILGKDVVSLEALFESMPVAMALLDREGRHVALNQALASFSGRRASELVGTRVAEQSEESGRNIERDFQLFDQGLNPPDHELQLGGRTYLVSVRPVRNPEGLAIGEMVALADITRNKEVQAELATANERLHHFALRDFLTDLWNRRYFDEALKREVAHAERSKGPLSVIVFDVDHFKCFNDTYGHIAGDECLKEVARVANVAARRATDQICRFGGEEFVVLLPGTARQGAVAVAEEIRTAVEGSRIPHSRSATGVVTVSLGVAELSPALEPRPVDSGKWLLEGADQALYLAKAEGRNGVRAWSGTP